MYETVSGWEFQNSECAETSDITGIQVQVTLKKPVQGGSERQPQVQRSWSGERFLMLHDQKTFSEKNTTELYRVQM